MSPDVARFLLDLVNRQQISVGAADFDEAVALVQAARKALAEVIDSGASTPA